MIEVIYKSSNGKTYNLIGDQMRVTSGSFHEYQWKKNVSKEVFGEKVNCFEKEAITYDMEINMKGSLKERYEMLDELRNAFEHDIISKTPGRIYFGDYYIECFVISSKTSKSGISHTWAQCKIKIYCPYPFWIKEEVKSFYAESDAHKENTDKFLDFPYDFSYDFKRPNIGLENWKIDHYAPSNFKMVIYGPAINPKITIDGYDYQVFDLIAQGEYIEIKSKEKTVTKNLADGTKENIFWKRNKETSVFEPIPSGDVLVNWNGSFGFDIALYLERSEPTWT